MGTEEIQVAESVSEAQELRDLLVHMVREGSKPDLGYESFTDRQRYLFVSIMKDAGLLKPQTDAEIPEGCFYVEVMKAGTTNAVSQYTTKGTDTEAAEKAVLDYVQSTSKLPDVALECLVFDNDGNVYGPHRVGVNLTAEVVASEPIVVNAE